MHVHINRSLNYVAFQSRQKEHKISNNTYFHFIYLEFSCCVRCDISMIQLTQ